MVRSRFTSSAFLQLSLLLTFVIAFSGAASAQVSLVRNLQDAERGRPLFTYRPAAGTAQPPLRIQSDATTSPTGISPSRIRRGYGFTSIANQGAGQTIGIVDAYDDPNIAADLSHFNSTFGLATCTTTSGCFKKVYASGSKPATNADWALEIALDVEWAHVIAPKAKIVLVEASSNSLLALLHGVDVAVQQGASVVSMSWGGSEFSTEGGYDSHFAINNVTFTVSSGDSGFGAQWPASSTGVVAVGGTRLSVDSSGNYISESAWSGSGGGLSRYELEPSYQSGFPVPRDSSGKRAVPDVAYDASPSTGVPVYDSLSLNGEHGWFQVGGTSASAPQWAGLFAIVNSIRRAAGKALLSHTNNSLYAIAKTTYSDYHDIHSGNNGTCGSLCNSVAGYDTVTGIGSPRASVLIPALANR
jgi:subtilase family serine protease